MKANAGTAYCACGKNMAQRQQYISPEGIGSPGSGGEAFSAGDTIYRMISGRRKAALPNGRIRCCAG